MVTTNPGPGEARLYFAEDIVIDGCAYEAGKPGVVAGAEAYRLEQAGIAFPTAEAMKQAIKARKAQAKQEGAEEQARAARNARYEQLKSELAEMSQAQLIELAQAEGIEGAKDIEAEDLAERLARAELAKEDETEE